MQHAHLMTGSCGGAEGSVESAIATVGPQLGHSARTSIFTDL
ncbi:hypothetical protein AB0O57_29090 [Streptomyces sp. NPDC091201]